VVDATLESAGFIDRFIRLIIEATLIDFLLLGNHPRNRAII